MGWANDVARIAQEIPRDLEARIGEVRSRRAGVCRFLTDADASRKKAFDALHKQILARQREARQQVAAMRQQAATTMAGFRREHAAAHAHWESMAKMQAKKRAGGEAPASKHKQAGAK